jgi:hypothetical protein
VLLVAVSSCAAQWTGGRGSESAIFGLPIRADGATLCSADLHSGAGDRVQHPSRDDGNYTGRCVDVHYVTNSPSLTVMTPDTTPIKWMPSVMDDGFLPDMGRMTPQWPPTEKSPVASVPSGAPICLPPFDPSLVLRHDGERMRIRQFVQS